MMLETRQGELAQGWVFRYDKSPDSPLCIVESKESGRPVVIWMDRQPTPNAWDPNNKDWANRKVYVIGQGKMVHRIELNEVTRGS